MTQKTPIPPICRGFALKTEEVGLGCTVDLLGTTASISAIHSGVILMTGAPAWTVPDSRTANTVAIASSLMWLSSLCGGHPFRFT